jgi:zinc transporter
MGQSGWAGTIRRRGLKSPYNPSIVATVFLPLSFLAGLLGMNVAGIPDEHDPRAFVIVCRAMVLIAIGSWMFLRGRRWT